MDKILFDFNVAISLANDPLLINTPIVLTNQNHYYINYMSFTMGLTAIMLWDVLFVSVYIKMTCE